MSEDSLEYFKKEILSRVEDLDFEVKGVFTPEELENYGVELLTEGTRELRSYDIDYCGFSFPMSVELGTFEGRQSIGISAENERIQDKNLDDLVSDIADSYDSWAQPLGNGDYILDIEN
ncbi:MAG: hypothetical protein ABEJ36_01155 [Candidatus Nanosalina sp.]